MTTDKKDDNFESALFDKLFLVKSMKMGTPLDVSVDESRNLNRSNTFVFAINVKEVAAMILTLREKRGKFLPSKHYEPMP